MHEPAVKRIQVGRSSYVDEVHNHDIALHQTLRINAPHFYRDPCFLNLINTKWNEFPPELVQRPIASWHRPGYEPDECSDVFLAIAFGPPYCEGDFFAELPEWIQEELVAAMQLVGFESGVVWITNLGDPDDYKQKG